MTRSKQNPAAGNHGENNTHWRDAATNDPSMRLDIQRLWIQQERAALKTLINSPSIIAVDEAKNVISRDFAIPYCQHIFNTWHSLAVGQVKAGLGAAEVDPNEILGELQSKGHTQAVGELMHFVTFAPEPNTARYRVPKAVETLKRIRFNRAMEQTGELLQKAGLNGSDDTAEQAMALLPFLHQVAGSAGFTTGEAA